MNTGQVNIRLIEPRDNAALAKIIRDSLAEFGANKPGTVYYDPTTDSLSEVFTKANSVYYVAEIDGEVVGGAGIYPTAGLGSHTCELIKMYLVPPMRGKGLGGSLINLCINFAKETGYKNIYLETMPELEKAVKIYQEYGFERLSAPLGQSGHFGCGIWMLKKLN